VALRYVKLEECIMNDIKSMYSGTTIAVKMINGFSKEFQVKV